MDSVYATTYVEDYTDAVENTPQEIQRHITRMHELSIDYTGNMEELAKTLEEFMDNYQPPVKVEAGEEAAGTSSSLDTKENEIKVNPQTNRLMAAQKLLMDAQEIGDEKLELAQSIQDAVDNKCRQLDLDRKNLGELGLTKLVRRREYGRQTESQQDNSKESGPPPERSVKRQRRAKHAVFVPSILGPSTLEVTSFIESTKAIIERETKPLSSRSSTAMVSQTATSSSAWSLPAIKQEPVSPTKAAVPIWSNASGGYQGQIKEEPVTPTKGCETYTASTSRRAANNRGFKIIDSPMSDRTSVSSGNFYSPTKKPTLKQLQQAEKKYKAEKKQKRKVEKKQKRNKDATPPDPIDPDEPTYCLCDQVSYGEMIGCDNDLCPIEWFHFTCVSLVNKPKGKWYCPKCRGDKPNIMKPRTLFLKELEKYNRMKEEKD